MDKPTLQESMLADVEYEPFIALVSNHDAEWSRTEYPDKSPWFAPYMEVATRLKRDCSSYRANVEQNYHDFCAANGVAGKQTLAPFLFAPVFYLPLGHSDLLSIVLLDDFDPIHYLTGRMTTTLESASVAFIPKLSSLGVTETDTNFCDLRSCCNGAVVSGESKHLPFLIHCKFKIDGLGALGVSLPFQIATMRAIVSKIRSITTSLREQGKTSSLIESQIAVEDVDNVKCALLDLQGCEEIGLLILCTNLSAAFAIVGGIRALTYGDVFAEDNTLSTFLCKSRIHQKLTSAKLSGNDSRLNLEGVGTALSDNHIFRWSHSSVSMLPESVWNPKTERLFPISSRLRGRLWAATKLQIAPGHFGRSGSVTSDTTPLHTNPESSDCYHYAVGLFDKVIYHSDRGIREAGNEIIDAGVLADNLETTLRRLCVSTDRTAVGRDVIELETDLVVPVPVIKNYNGQALLCGGLGSRHFAPLSSTLPKLIERLCYFSNIEKNDASEAARIRETAAPYQPGPLDIPTLMDAQRRLGIPVSLRRTFEYLFQNFAIITSDPFSFDVLLDLYDAFATIHAIITKHLLSPALQLGKCEGHSGEGRRLLDEDRVKCLAEIAESLHNAISHRIGNAFRDSSWRDMAVHFRGGMNQMLFAADAPVKCGLGIVRRFVTADSSGSHARNSAGCVMRLSMTPGARCCIPTFGVEKRARLVFFDVDVPHVLHVPSYADFLHEAFHVVFKALHGERRFLLDEPSNNTEQADMERLEEIFALSLWKMFVFGDDSKTFFYRNVLAFSRDISSFGSEDSETCRRFSEVLLRLFLAAYGFYDQQGDPRTWSVTVSPVSPSHAEVRSAYADFIKEVGPFFSEYQRLWVDDPEKRALAFSVAHFDKVYGRISRSLPSIWGEALSAYKRTAMITLPCSEAEVPEINGYLDAQVEQALEGGRPILWNKYPIQQHFERKNDPQEIAHNIDGVSAVHFVCKTLHGYMRGIRSASGKQMHLLRDANYAKLRYSPHSNWWEFQADKGATALFSCVPESRGNRIRKEIVILKSFWNLSSEIRARRLLEMLTVSGL